jgi:steroid 5-alpha reductase family enzyme
MQAHTPLVMSDHILASLALVTLMAEFTADNQQYSFQTYKQSRVINKNEWIGARIQWTPEDAKRGFVTRGLWAWSRHPNFLCEQMFWVTLSINSQVDKY